LAAKKKMLFFFSTTREKKKGKILKRERSGVGQRRGKSEERGGKRLCRNKKDQEVR